MCYNTEVAINVKNLSKVYKIFESPGKRLCYHLLNINGGRDFLALDNISFQVKKGETFGIIGRNGSGKSTLLQLLAGIIRPTSGEMQVNGKVAALLELGSGFNPENTGYENIYMNAAILGVGKKEIEKKIEEIVDFADIGEFISQPVKTYSSGMYIRLAFAVAINVDADILLIDEALAVGDVFFRQKCYAKLNKLKEEGKTIILVSHGMNEVEQFCDRALLLNKSHTIMLGDSRNVVRRYYIIDQQECESKEEGLSIEDIDENKNNEQNSKIEWGESGWSPKEDVFYNLENSIETTNHKAEFSKIGLFDEEGRCKRVFQQGDMAYFYYEININSDIEVPVIGTVLYDQRNTIIHGKDNLQMYSEVPQRVNRGETLCVVQKIKLDVGVGDYTFAPGFGTIAEKDYERRGLKEQELINEELERICERTNAGFFSVHTRKIGDPMRLMFHGCCDLEGEIVIKVRKTNRERR